MSGVTQVRLRDFPEAQALSRRCRGTFDLPSNRWRLEEATSSGDWRRGEHRMEFWVWR